MRARSWTTVAAVVVLVALGAPSASAQVSPPSRARFIITLHDDADPGAVAAEYDEAGAEIDHVYRRVLNGFAGAMSDADIAELRSDRRVARIERDGIATAQANATWGLDRIDQRALPLDGTYASEPNGAGVTAYVVDTGIRTSHIEFAGRASTLYFDSFGGNGQDCNGHGTHVAGTIGGTTYGVAKAVSLVAVRVLDCGGSGSWSGVIAGLDWVANNAVAPAVANMSLGGGASSSVDDAVRRLIESGVTVAVAAGNGNQAGVAQNACNYSPARVTEALTIGATTKTDTKSSFSNYGSCVDFFAPGSGITSAWYGADTQINTISGTSMATPHVAGVAALYLQGSTGATPAQVGGALAAATTKDVVTSSSTANNDLLFSGLTASSEEPPAPASMTLTLSTGKKNKSGTQVKANWTDSEGTNRSYDVWAGGAIIATVTGSSHTRTWPRGTTVTYEVCRAGAKTVCAPTQTITV